MRSGRVTQVMLVVAALVAALALAPSPGAATELSAWGSEAQGKPGGPVMLAQGGSQVERGRAVFAANCATCHGTDGQGTSQGPRLIGSPNGLREYGTTAKLFDFIKTSMPADKEGSLKNEEYWDVLAFILDGNKLLPPGMTLGPDTVERVTLNP